MRQQHIRRGVILLVVMALLSLFAAVGIGFVIYAESAATSAKYNREAYAPTQPDIDPELMMNYFLSQLLYDTDNLYSAMRGHSLGRSLFGLHYDGVALGQNDIPFNGIGRLGYQHTAPSVMGMVDRDLINYTYFPGDSFLRDPERLGTRTSDSDPMGPYIRMANVPYTFPDHNNVFLAMINADGEVLSPSFHRPFIFGKDDVSNLNWTNAGGKYLTLTPRPQDHTSDFPLPTGGGHVKNLDASPGTRKVGGGYLNNDSYWMDIGFPVLVAKDGRKYKPLVAALVLDLDGKVNVNASGNVRGVDVNGQPVHASTHGYGPWEINISRVLKKTDWANLLTHTTMGRYGADRGPALAGAQVLPNPASGRPLIFAEPGPVTAPVDIDGVDATAVPTTKMLMPGEAGTLAHVGWPIYSGGYGNADTTERTNHPALYSPNNPNLPAEGAAGPSDDRSIPISELEALLRYSSTGSPALLSELFQMCYGSFNDPANPLASKRARRALTPTTFDFAQPGPTPWLNGPGNYEIPDTAMAEKKYPIGVASNPYSSLVGPGGTLLGAGIGSEFRPDLSGGVRALQGSAPLVQRLLINRPLPPYPAPTDGRLTDKAAFNEAQIARQKLAKDMFELLRLVTMGPVAMSDPMPPEEQETLSWLAQLAVNIVDYRDADDYMTPFEWKSGLWVYGTELPKLVINEVYTELQEKRTGGGGAPNPGKGKGKGKGNKKNEDTEVNFWVELLNPLVRDPNRKDALYEANSGDAVAAQSAVRLEVPGAGAVKEYGVYKLVIAVPPDAGKSLFKDEITGEPDPDNTVLEISKYEPEKGAATDDVRVVKAVHDAYKGTNGGNDGFFLLGPVEKVAFPVDPKVPAAEVPVPTLRVKEQDVNGIPNAMSYTVAKNDPTPEKHNFFLRRLACPHLKPWSDPTDPTEPYNPYITVDYMLNVECIDGTLNAGNKRETKFEDSYSRGRRQPYAGSRTEKQTPDSDDSTMDMSEPFTDRPQHTLFRHNAVEEMGPPTARVDQTVDVPFDWLVHLDRYLVSPVELLHVNCFKPHELTQYFMISKEKRFQHQAPWVANGGNDTRLYRLLEFVDTGHRAAGVSMDGRIPGKININTAFYEALLALSDPQPSSTFQEAGVQTSFANIGRENADGTLNKDFRPFTSLATGFFSPNTTSPYPNGAGVDDTLLRRLNPSTDPKNTRLFEASVGSDHPWMRYDMLNKIFNNTTTRSNVFAVWVTVGLFEVKDENARPMKLGGEIGFLQNRHVRHRMFAIVDRSQMKIRMADSDGHEVSMNLQAPINVPFGEVREEEIMGAVAFDTINGRKWEIKVGTRLTFDPDQENEETVEVTKVDLTQNPPKFWANFTRSHAASARIICRGNMGPWTTIRYDMRKDPEVVRFFSVIK